MILWFGAACSPLSWAHDVGIVEVFVYGSSEGKFRLLIEAPMNDGATLVPPKLPLGCVFDGPSSILGVRTEYHFSCDSNQHYLQKSIVLPWRNAAILLHLESPSYSAAPFMMVRQSEGYSVPLSKLGLLDVTGAEVALQYTMLGMEHILEGIDHLAFVLMMLFLIKSRWSLLMVVSAFTFGHSLTLMASFLGGFSISAVVVEVCIAFSIVILAWECIRQQHGEISVTQLKPVWVAVGFGLLHGLGFAGALRGMDIPESDKLIGLLFFNVGVECGQLLFIALVFTLLLPLKTLVQFSGHGGRLHRFGYYATSYWVGGVSMYWTLERMSPLWP